MSDILTKLRELREERKEHISKITERMRKISETRRKIKDILRSKGPLTVPEIAKELNIEPSEITQHIIAMFQNGEIEVIGIKNDYYLYKLSSR